MASVRVKREQMFGALFALFDPALLIGTGTNPDIAMFNQVGRRLKDPTGSDIGSKPAFFQVEDDQIYDNGIQGAPKKTFKVRLFICADVGDEEPIPATIYNPLIDAVEGAMIASNPPGEKQTLGGLVANAYFDGKITISTGVVGQMAVVSIPVTILTGI